MPLATELTFLSSAAKLGVSKDEGEFFKLTPFDEMAVTTEFSAALNQVCAEKGISAAAVLETIEVALISAYRKDNRGVPLDELRAEVDAETGEAKIFHNQKDVTPAGFGRIASQTAKQILLQRLREAEKNTIIEDYQKRVGTIVSGHIFRVEGGVVVLDLGRAQGVMPPQEQLPSEHYQINQRFKVLVKEVREGGRIVKGPEIVVSRSDPRFVKELFTLEVPELSSGAVEVKAIAREAGERTKIAVWSAEEKIDPVGSCVGQKGVRVRAVIAELGSEKIDIIQYDEDPQKFIAYSLSPAKVKEISLNKKKKEAKVEVSDDQLSLAIGKEGQNVRLAAKLTGWRIDISGPARRRRPESAAAQVAAAEELVRLGVGKRAANALARAGITTAAAARKMLKEKTKVDGIGPKSLLEIAKAVSGQER